MDDLSRTARAIDAATGLPRLPDHGDLQRLLAYWADRCGSRQFPRRADIDPVDLAFMLNRIGLTEVYESDPRSDQERLASEKPAIPSSGGRFYRFRLVGSWWRDITGYELTGAWSDQLPNPRMTDITVSFYEMMIAGRRPHFTSRDAWIEERRLNYQILILPLSEDGHRISMIMTGIGPRDP